jgi:hypothetical protein
MDPKSHADVKYDLITDNSESESKKIDTHDFAVEIKENEEPELQPEEVPVLGRQSSITFGVQEPAETDRHVDTVNPNNNGPNDRQGSFVHKADYDDHPEDREKEDILESETPLAFFNMHLFEQIDKKGSFKTHEGSAKVDNLEVENRHLLDLFSVVTVTDILNVDPVNETFSLKYRTFNLWHCDLQDYPELSDLVEKAQKSGHYYPLSRSEVDHFAKFYHIPKINLFNQVSTAETDVLDIRIYGGERGKTAIMFNQSFLSVVRERFILHHFPFDLQRLVLDFRLNDARSWNTYNLQICMIQFHRDCLHQLEWSICIPTVQRGVPKSSNSKVIIPIQRKIGYYVQNVILIVLVLSALGLSTFAFKSEDLVGRTFVVLTLILTCVAFKFTTLAESLPKVPYSTLMDHFMACGIWSLAIMTVFTIIPSFYVDEADADGVDNTINLALSMASIGMLVIGFGALLVISYVTVRAHLRDHVIIPVNRDRPWYAFRYSNPKFLQQIDLTKSFHESMAEMATTNKRASFFRKA